jgi:D-alanyl-D-alanine carboxypeptidase
MRPTRWRPSTHLFVGVGVLAIVAAVVAATALLTRSGRAGVAQVSPPPPGVTAKSSIVPAAASAPMPSTAGLAAALAAAAADPNLGRLGGRVTDAMTGKELWQQLDDVQLQPASTNKTLTSAAALLALTMRPGSAPAWSRPTSPGLSCWSVAATRRCRGRRRGRTPGITVRRGSAISPIRYVAAV